LEKRYGKRYVKQMDYDHKSVRATKRQQTLDKARSKQMILLQNRYAEDKSEYDKFSASVDVAVLQFRDLLETEGYYRHGRVSRVASQIEAPLLAKSFRRFAEGYNLYNAHALHRLTKEGVSTLPSTSTDPLPVGDSRLVLLRAWICSGDELAASVRPFFPGMSFEKQMFIANWFRKKAVNSIVSSAVTGVREAITARYNECLAMLRQVCDYIPFVLLKYLAIGLTIALVGSATYFLLNHLMPLTHPGSSPDAYIKQGDDEQPESMNVFKKNFIYDAASSFGSFSKKFVENMSPAAWVKEIHAFSKFTVSLRNIGEFFRTLYNFACAVVDRIAVWFTGTPFFKSSQEVAAFIHEIKELSEFTRQPDALEASKAKEFIDKYNRAHQLLGVVKMWPNSHNEKLLLARTIAEGHSHYQKCLSQIGVNRVRPDPVVIYYCGPSKNGKTTLKGMVNEAVYYSLYNQNLRTEQHYLRNSAQTHWDGYTNGVWATTFDDIFQQSDPATRSLECMDVIRCANVDPVRLNMAALEDKSSTFFESRLISLTTNEGPFPVNLGIHEPRAFYRRCNFIVSVSLKPGTVPSIHPSPMDAKNFLIHLYGTDNRGTPDKTKDETIDFVEFVNRVTAAVARNNEGYESRQVPRDWSDLFGPVDNPYVNKKEQEKTDRDQLVKKFIVSSNANDDDDSDSDRDKFVFARDDAAGTGLIDDEISLLKKNQCFGWSTRYNKAWQSAYYDSLGVKYGTKARATYADVDIYKTEVNAQHLQYFLDHPRSTEFPSFLFAGDPSANACHTSKRYIALPESKNDYAIYCPAKSTISYYERYTSAYLEYRGNPFLETIKDAFSSVEKVAAVLLAGTTVGLLAFTLRSLLGDSCPAFFKQSEDPKSTTAQTAHRTTVYEALRAGKSIPIGSKVEVLMAPSKPKPYAKQGSSHMGTRRIFHNIFYACSRAGDTVLSGFFVTFVTGHTAACALHCWDACAEEVNIQMVRNQPHNNVYTFRRSEVIATRWPEYDLCLFTVPQGNWLAMKNLEAHIPDDFYTKEFEGVARLGYTEDGSCATMTIGRSVIPSNVQRNPYVSEDFYYRATGVMGNAGDCGLPYFILNNGAPRKFLGIHNGRQADDGYVTPITTALLKKHQDKLTCKFQQVASSFSFTKPRFYEGCKVEVTPADGERHSFRVLYHTNRPPFCPTKTQLQASPLLTGIGNLPRIWENTEAPADLSREAMHNGFRKVANKKFRYNRMLEDPEVWQGVFHDGMTARAVEPLTLEQVCFGDPMLKGINSYAPDTSNGYPWASEGILKDDLIRKPTATEKGFIDQRLVNAVDARSNAARRRKMIPVLCQATLKDETRPLSRVKAKYTRVMFPAPIDSTAFEKMYWGNFVSQLESTIHKDVQVGLNPYNMCWTLLGRQLSSFSKEVVAGDFDGWDIRTAIHVFAFNLWMQVCIRYSIDPDSDRGLLLFASLMSASQPLLVVEHDLCLAPIQVSGRYSTSWLNSVANSVATRVCFKHAYLRQKTTDPGLGAITFDDVCRLLVSGDDNIMAVRDSVRLWWNGKVKAQLFSELFYLITTAPDKSPEVAESYALESADFLSRRFVAEGSMFLAPLNEESMKNSVLWVRKSKETSVYLQTITNIHNALFEWAAYPEAKFNAYKNTLNLYIVAMGYPSKQFLYTWKQVRDAYTVKHFE
jgi:hypothetical protein